MNKKTVIGICGLLLILCVEYMTWRRQGEHIVRENEITVCKKEGITKK